MSQNVSEGNCLLAGLPPWWCLPRALHPAPLAPGEGGRGRRELSILTRSLVGHQFTFPQQSEQEEKGGGSRRRERGVRSEVARGQRSLERGDEEGGRSVSRLGSLTLSGDSTLNSGVHVCSTVLV